MVETAATLVSNVGETGSMHREGENNVDKMLLRCREGRKWSEALKDRKKDAGKWICKQTVRI